MVEGVVVVGAEGAAVGAVVVVGGVAFVVTGTTVVVVVVFGVVVAVVDATVDVVTFVTVVVVTDTGVVVTVVVDVLTERGVVVVVTVVFGETAFVVVVVGPVEVAAFVRVAAPADPLVAHMPIPVMAMAITTVTAVPMRRPVPRRMPLVWIFSASCPWYIAPPSTHLGPEIDAAVPANGLLRQPG